MGTGRSILYPKAIFTQFHLWPRQVGKTTMIKLIIKNLPNEVKPEAIFYYSCDLLNDYEDLLDVLRRYLKIKEERGIKTSYIFLDEITYVNERSRAIKYGIDRGCLGMMSLP